MAARAIWKGEIKLGTTKVPVKLYSAVQDRTVRFHVLDDRAKKRVKQHMVDPDSGDEVPAEEIQKGYEIEPGRYVILTAEELEKLQIRFATDWEKIAQIPVVQEVLSHIPELCERHPLRGADAIHLSSALLLFREGLEVTFACSDLRLLEAAAAEGLLTFDPAQAAPSPA